MIPAPTQEQILTQLQAFLLAVLGLTPDAVVTGQQNRMAEPQTGRFIVMTPMRETRLRTNVKTNADAVYAGSIAGATMTVTSVARGKINIGAPIFGVGVAASSVVQSQITGPPGGVGTYGIAPVQAVAVETLSSGQQTIEQGVQIAVQLDFHTDDALGAGDDAAVVSTLMRDSFAVEQFAAQVPNYGVVPLYADDPHQAPFMNEAQQVETRWVVDAMLQANIVIAIPQQFADSTVVTPISVEATYSP